ncbi:MAG: GNAT family N-acetyltransferase [bacterium]
MEIKIEKTDKAAKIALFLDGEEVSHLWVIDYEMRIGSAVMKMGGIAGVWTDEKHRLKGYASKVMEASIKYMKEEGYDVSLLFGIPNFYHRFGFATVLPRYRAELEVDKLPSSSGNFELRSYEERFKEAVLEIYSENNKVRTGTLLRSPTKWEGFSHGNEWSSKALPYVLLDGEEVIAYLVFDSVEPMVIELGYKKPRIDVFQALLCQIRRFAEERNSPVIRLILPPDFTFTEFCQRYDLRLNIEFPENRDGMGRVINIITFLYKLQDVFRSRIGFNKREGILIIETDIGEVPFDIKKDTVFFMPFLPPSGWKLKLPQAKLIQLAMGYRSIDELLLDGDVSLEGEEALPILRKLFPKQFPFFWPADRF